ncbi:GNAT family N-acetyltransferase [Mobilitalea sibirica]|uniref:GNAT family N-acetyltransferase n=1 Tax=Mobilitalea sibirica TaxID=1462919 RepID=A0A8J7HDD0_9FIRM|nr:GNAT family N-acetyltransferase [Mobilitalea sibirica]MBH1940609.1 GNAT family N-acetyltransferase [Mobilitalea sibirica]
MREMSIDDAQDIFEYQSDREFMRYTGLPPHQSIKQTQAMIIKYASYFYEGIGLAWSITDKHSNKVIGNIIMCYTDPLKKTKARVGYHICPDYQNQGIATWALGNCIKFGFNQLDLTEIEAKCKSVNLASERVMQKCCMVIKEIKPSPFLVEGVYYDMKTYSIKRLTK